MTERFASDERDAYNAGVIARNNHDTRATCPHELLSRLGSWWLAGWHDCDIARLKAVMRIAA